MLPLIMVFGTHNSHDHRASLGTKMIDLYTDARPDDLKISIALEALDLEYQAHRIYLRGDQMTDEFTKMNPNQKSPVERRCNHPCRIRGHSLLPGLKDWEITLK